MKRIWIIDDHSAFRKTLAQILKSAVPALEVRQFGSCELALEAMKEEPAPQLLLLDIQLRGMSGLDGISLFKDRNSQTCVVVLTVFEDDEKLFQAICAGANGYVLKTQSALEISSAVKTALDGGAPMTPRIARRVLDMFAQFAPKKNPDYGLSARETEVLQCVVEGLLKKEIAARLQLSVHTVDAYLRRIYEKLHVNSRSGAISKALKENLI